jgi:hypothetical protein
LYRHSHSETSTNCTLYIILLYLYWCSYRQNKLVSAFKTYLLSVDLADNVLFAAFMDAAANLFGATTWHCALEMRVQMIKCVLVGLKYGTKVSIINTDTCVSFDRPGKRPVIQ